MNLQSFEQELQDWFDGGRTELSDAARAFCEQNTEAGNLYAQMCALRQTSRNLGTVELDSATATAIKAGVWQELAKPDKGQWRQRSRTIIYRHRRLPLATAFAAALLFVVWLWPRLHSPVQEQDFEFYVEQHKLASGDMLAAE